MSFREQIIQFSIQIQHFLQYVHTLEWAVWALYEPFPFPAPFSQHGVDFVTDVHRWYVPIGVAAISCLKCPYCIPSSSCPIWPINVPYQVRIIFRASGTMSCLSSLCPVCIDAWIMSCLSGLYRVRWPIWPIYGPINPVPLAGPLLEIGFRKAGFPATRDHVERAGSGFYHNKQK